MMVPCLSLRATYFRLRKDVSGRHMLLLPQGFSREMRFGRASDGDGEKKKTFFSSSGSTRLCFRYRISISSEMTFLIGELTIPEESSRGVDGAGVVAFSRIIMCDIMVLFKRFRALGCD